MADEPLSDADLRHVLATSPDPGARVAARRELLARGGPAGAPADRRRALLARPDDTPMPDRVGTADPPWAAVADEVEAHTRGRGPITLSEAGRVVRDAIAALRPKGR